MTGDRIAPRVPAPTPGTARRRLRREHRLFVFWVARLLIRVANSPPPPAQRQQTTAMAESLAGAWPVLLRPLAPSQSGETVSKERLRFDTRQIEPQRKIALGNINTLTLALNLIDACFSNRPHNPPKWLTIPGVALASRGACSLNYVPK
jgi:hypothetical protein